MNDPDPSLDPPAPRPGRAWVFWLWNALASVVLLGLLELGLYACLRFPSLTKILPDTLRHGVSLIYHERDRILIHRHSEWHPLVTYTIKPGTTNLVESREFTMQVRGNSLGLRDDEASLASPELVVLGDSFSMGYGMAVEETYASHLERATGLKVLNTALESYATARQVLTFNQRLETSAVERLIVQYCDNDVWENLSFLAHGGELPIQSEAEYWGWVERRHRASWYRPFRYLRDVGRAVLIDLRPADAAVTEERLELHHVFHAQAFLRTLSHLQLPNPDVQVVALDLWDEADMQYLRRDDFRRGLYFDSRLFMQAIRQELREGEYPEFLETMALVDTSMLLGPEDRFTLDGHIRASGHAKIAAQLESWIAGEAMPEIPERAFLTSPADRRSQLLTAPLPRAAAESTVACAAEVAVGERPASIEVMVENRSPHWWPAHSVAPGLEPVQLVGRWRDPAWSSDASPGEPVVQALPRAVGPGERLAVTVFLDADQVPPDGGILELDLGSRLDGEERMLRFAELGGRSCLVEAKR